MMLKQLLFRITHIKNLDFILKNGIPCKNSHIKDPNFVPIGYPTLIEERSSVNVPVEPYGVLADYVPFYFTVKSPMLYVITKGNDPEVIKTNPDEIIYLVSSVEKIIEYSLKFVFTDRHARLKHAKFYTQVQDLEKLNWSIINSPNWGRQYGSERMEIKQAEFLVHRHVPVDALIEIACKDEEKEKLIKEKLNLYNKKIIVKIRRDWYF